VYVGGEHQGGETDRGCCRVCHRHVASQDGLRKLEVREGYSNPKDQVEALEKLLRKLPNLADPTPLTALGYRPGLRFPPNSGQVIKQLSLRLSGTARTKQD
jgi:hypothetical protein